MSARDPIFTLSFSSVFNGVVAGGMIMATLLISWLAVTESRDAALDGAQARFSEITASVKTNVENLLNSATTLTSAAALALAPGYPRPSGGDPQTLAFLKSVLDMNPDLMSAYIGFDDGGFYQIISPRGGGSLPKSYEAPARTSRIERIIAANGAGRVQTWRFFDKEGTVLLTREDPAPSYDPRKRPWFEKARGTDGIVLTAPYVFSSSRLPGITCARSLANGPGVFGIDLSLAQLGEILARQNVAQNGAVYIVDGAGRLVASPGADPGKIAGDDLLLPMAADSADPVLAASAKAALSGGLTGSAIIQAGAASEPYLLSASTVFSIPDGGSDGRERLVALIAAPEGDFTSRTGRMVKRILLLAALALAATLGAAIFAGSRISRPVSLLAGEAEKIQNLDFSGADEIESRVREISALSRSFEIMKTALKAKTEGLFRARNKLEKLVEGGLALSAEKDLANLVTLILQTARDIAQADGGAVYLKDKDVFGVELLSLKSENVVLGGLSGNPAPRVTVRAEIMPFLKKDTVLYHACAALSSRGCSRVSADRLALFPTGLTPEPSDYVIRSLVSFPIITRRDEVLGVMQLFNPAAMPDSPGGAVNDVDGTEPDIDGFLGSLAAQAAVTLDNRNLVESLEKLFDALILVIASSIDAKSPYTAGHCSRVPELAGMLAQAADETPDGPLKDFRISGRDGWRQLWIASWLHDCGKIITPGHVTDKAVKLECVYNRIHEIRARFEILRRDAEIRLLRRIMERGDHPEDRQAYEKELRDLEEDFAFIASCNLGGEFMRDEDKGRLREIAQRTYQRHFSDRLGLSAEELGRKDGEEPPLPAVESVLADKPEHRIKRVNRYADLADIHGNPLTVPENKYDLGELYNLSIAKGTLTDEERFIINEHAISGLQMLLNIPFPEKLGRVADIAAAHHETLTGTGYPLKKSKEQLPVEARILAIADIFEALTAADRPYKKSKTLSEALRIMSFMRNDGQIDPDLFDIFLMKGVYAAYAEKHLDPAQRDVEDVTPFLSETTRARIAGQGASHAHA